jgi:hypothetical protein
VRGLKWVATTFVVAAGLSAVTASVAGAQAYEPNDSFTQAYGPLIGGQNYDAAKETDNDQDWFYFNVNGQRQLDIALTGLANCGGYQYAELYDINGNAFKSGDSFSTGTTSHLRYTTEARVQLGIRVRADIGSRCQYRIQVGPADAITTEAPGIVARFLATNDGDAVQRIFLDGQLMGENRGGSSTSVSLGHPGPASQITYEAQNVSGSYAWGVEITDVKARGATTIFTEDRTGGCCSSANRVGIVRRVVLTPTGGLISSCGEAIAPLTCFPRDSDGDGVEDNADQCKDERGVAPTGCADADADGVPDSTDKCSTTPGPGPSGCPVKQRVAASVTLKRRGSTYSGRVSSPQAGCVAKRRVVLRVVGKGTRAYGSATVRSRGTFTIRRSKRLRGRVYVALAATKTSTLICEKAASKRIRG